MHESQQLVREYSILQFFAPIIWICPELALLAVSHRGLHPGTKTWTAFLPMFKKEFATQTDDQIMVDSLGHIAMRPNENTRDEFPRITQIIKCVQDNFPSYSKKSD
jgi:hypothetical protein